MNKRYAETTKDRRVERRRTHASGQYPMTSEAEVVIEIESLSFRNEEMESKVKEEPFTVFVGASSYSFQFHLMPRNSLSFSDRLLQTGMLFSFDPSSCRRARCCSIAIQSTVVTCGDHDKISVSLKRTDASLATRERINSGR